MDALRRAGRTTTGAFLSYPVDVDPLCSEPALLTFEQWLERALSPESLDLCRSESLFGIDGPRIRAAYTLYRDGWRFRQKTNAGMASGATAVSSEAQPRAMAIMSLEAV
jgi:hypothetical protein